MVKIYHSADIHLGRRRLDGLLPDFDFADALDYIVSTAIEDGADLFLLAGDLFDRPQVEPPHLGQALQILRRLREASIPVVAIEGNHDKAFVHSGEPTWIHHLAQEELLILLQPRFGPDGAILDEWCPETKQGSWIDIAGIRFVGAGYLGAATPNKVRQIVSAMDTDATNVLLLHAGPDYFVGEGGGFSSEDLEQLRTKCCYLALGHIHKPMIYNGWACNPGSPENCDLNEARYGFDENGEDKGRGYAVVEIDPQLDSPLVSIEVRSNPRRHCLRIELDCTPFGNKTKQGVEAFIEKACNEIKAHDSDTESIVDLRLTGKLNLNRIALDPSLASLEIAEKTKVFAVAIDPTRLNVDAAFGAGQEGFGEGVSREFLERSALDTLLVEENLWGLEEDRQAIADLLYALKEGVLHEQSAEGLAEQIATNPLVDKVVRAKNEARISQQA